MVIIVKVRILPAEPVLRPLVEARHAAGPPPHTRRRDAEAAAGAGLTRPGFRGEEFCEGEVEGLPPHLGVSKWMDS